MTHDPKIDDQALSIFMSSEAEYIGALGSRKSHEARLKRLGQLGFEEEALVEYVPRSDWISIAKLLLRLP